VSSPKAHAGKHRASKARRAPKAALKTSLTLSSMAVVATGFAVGGGSLSFTGGGPAASTTASVADLKAPAGAAATPAAGPAATDTSSADSAPSQADLAAAEADRAQQPVTRSDSRASADPVKKDTLSLGAGNTMSRSENLSDEAPQDIARALLASFGWSEDQFGCLDSLWTRESNWNVHAANPSGAYGIPQSLPGSKMASAGSDWQDNAVTQIKWGLGYIQDRYGSPCGAWAHSEGHGWY
jgi:hypothetical protein